MWGWTDDAGMSEDSFSMTRVRRVLGHVVVVWLSGQLALAAFSPETLWSDPAGSHAAVCTCTHGTDAACPMHRNTASGSRTCVLRAAADQSAAQLTSLFGATGPPVLRTQFFAPACATPVPIVEWQMIVEHPASPDPPPPRS
jgi:hypothetical protein